MTARETSKRAEIPYSKTYEILSHLERKGLIQVQRGRPQLFKALPAAVGLERIERISRLAIERDYSEKRHHLEEEMKRQTDKLTQSRQLASEVLSKLSKAGPRIEATDSVVWTITGKDNAIEQIKSLLPTARKRVSMILPDDNFEPFDEELRSLSHKKIRVDLIVNKLTETVGLLSPLLTVGRPVHGPPNEVRNRPHRRQNRRLYRRGLRDQFQNF